MSGRDISRAQWQRGEGMVLYSNHADNAYADNTMYLDDAALSEILSNQYSSSSSDYNEFSFEGTEDPIVIQAVRIANALFPSPNKQFGSQHTIPSLIENNIGRHTYAQTFEGTFEEANDTMRAFPLTLALTLSAAASERGIAGYELQCLRDYAAMFRKKDFRNMVDAAAFTNSGFWGSYSNSMEPDLRPLIGDDAIVYDQDSEQMGFSEPFVRQLHERMRLKNKKGDSDAPNIAVRPSSGCPARHLAPHFEGNQNSGASIEALAKHFGMSASEVVATREKSAINVGLDYLADAFERAAKLQESLAVTALVACG